jgi:ribosomal protein S18 acetylase RimI-like enzyme
MDIHLCTYNKNRDHKVLYELRTDPFTQRMLCGNPNGSQEDITKWVSRRSTQGWFRVIVSSNEGMNDCRGFVQLSSMNHNSKFAWLGICIHSSCRGLGIGKLAMRLLHNEIDKLGLNKVLLEVRVDNFAAIHLYRNLGYVVVGELHKHYWDGEKFIDISIMERLSNR